MGELRSAQEVKLKLELEKKVFSRKGEGVWIRKSTRNGGGGLTRRQGRRKREQKRAAKRGGDSETKMSEALPCPLSSPTLPRQYQHLSLCLSLSLCFSSFPMPSSFFSLFLSLLLFLFSPFLSLSSSLCVRNLDQWSGVFSFSLV